MAPTGLDVQIDDFIRNCGLEPQGAVVLPWDWHEPLAVVEPTSADDVAKLALGCDTYGFALVPTGGGTDLSMGAPPAKPYLLVKTTGMNRVLEYEPDEMVVVCQSGVTLKQLQNVLAPHRQRIPLRLPFDGMSTLGGIVSTNRAGVLRAAYGAPRDLLIGLSAVMSGGTTIKGGGKVVKNVAGYDLCKLFTGSYGTLGIVTAVNLKTTVTTDEDVTLLWDAPNFQIALDAGFRLHQGRLFTAGICAANDLKSGGPVLAVYLQGVGQRIEWQRNAIDDILLPLGFQAARRASDDEASLLLEWMSPFKKDNLLWFAHCSILPSDVPAAASRIASVCSSSRITAIPGTGELFIAVPDGAEYWPWHLQDAVPDEGNVRFAYVGPEVLSEGTVSRWGRRLPAAHLHHALKQRLDPGNCFNPGRFVDGI